MEELREIAEEVLVKVLGYNEEEAKEYVGNHLAVISPEKSLIELPNNLGTII